MYYYGAYIKRGKTPEVSKLPRRKWFNNNLWSNKLSKRGGRRERARIKSKTLSRGHFWAADAQRANPKEIQKCTAAAVWVMMTQIAPNSCTQTRPGHFCILHVIIRCDNIARQALWKYQVSSSKLFGCGTKIMTRLNNKTSCRRKPVCSLAIRNFLWAETTISQAALATHSDWFSPQRLE